MKTSRQTTHWTLAVFLCGLPTPALLNAKPAPPPLAQVEPGTVAISCPWQSASYSFDRATGKAGSASEGAQNAVASLLNTPELGHPQLEAALGVLEFVASPFVAGYGAVRGGHQRLDADQLAQTEEAVRSALAKMAKQTVFREFVIAAATEKTGRRLQTVDLPENSETTSRFSAWLTIEVDQLRLHRTRATDKSFRLEIAAQGRLVRPTDGTVLYQKAITYQSGEELFVDWGRYDGLESVARTGYQQLAAQIVNEVFSAPTVPLVRLGEKVDAKPRFVNSAAPLYFDLVAATPARQVPTRPQLRQVGYHTTEPEAIEVMPDLSSREFQIQGLTGSSGLSEETPTDTEYALDGLENHPNFVVQIAGCVGAIPMGLWEHTVGAFRSGSEESWRAADAMLKLSSRRQPAQVAVAQEVAQILAHPTSERVRDNARGDQNDPVGVFPGSSLPSEISAPRNSGKPGTVLRIRTVQSRLCGKSGRNPRLQVCVEIKAVLVRTSDGQELLNLPVSYQSQFRRLKDWAAQDGLMLQRQLNASYTAISQAIVTELTSAGFVAPAGTPSTWAVR